MGPTHAHTLIVLCTILNLKQTIFEFDEASDHAATVLDHQRNAPLACIAFQH
jgi:hypothetical protein